MPSSGSLEFALPAVATDDNEEDEEFDDLLESLDDALEPFDSSITSNDVFFTTDEDDRNNSACTEFIIEKDAKKKEAKTKSKPNRTKSKSKSKSIKKAVAVPVVAVENADEEDEAQKITKQQQQKKKKKKIHGWQPPAPLDDFGGSSVSVGTNSTNNSRDSGGEIDLSAWVIGLRKNESKATDHNDNRRRRHHHDMGYDAILSRLIDKELESQ